MWHSSSTQHFQNRWDGGDGFKDMFLRREYPVFLWDGPGIGRANYGCEEVTYSACYNDIETFHSLNFGPSAQFNPASGGVVLAQGKLWWSDSQFPVDDLAAWNQAARARYQDFNADEDLQLQAQAAAVAADSGRLGTDIVYLTHSYAGPGALMAVMKSKKENIKGVVLYETSGVVYPEGAQVNATLNPSFVPVDNFKNLAKLKAVQFVWGDHKVGNLDSSSEQLQAVAGSYIVADLINKLGGNAEVIVLPQTDVGRGNTNVPFAGMNNAKVADLLDKLLEKNKLDECESKPDLWGC
ncbi:hypothetical protein HYALB_00000218 [Hymenoscyphus albidus]|uniref:Uncharacterized protein n=1 Tax=Hymenoscyphus albidus TaxID=595503 RepID=A0A9N9LVA9_9HELO|nr:hypothetical protein HYALB_00000218 [Hymenoscyphus albidus]